MWNWHYSDSWMILHWLSNLRTYTLWYSGGRYASLKPLRREEAEEEGAAEEEAEQQVVLADGVRVLHLCRATQRGLESRAFLVCVERRTWMQLALHVPPEFWREAQMKRLPFLSHNLIRAVEYEVINNQWCTMNLCTKTKTLADKKTPNISKSMCCELSS